MQRSIRSLARFAPPPELALLLLAAAASLWPYASLLDRWPQTTDGALWITRGAFTNPHWFDWGCCRPHFVFYRPVVAFSYTLSYALGGLDPFVYRLSDGLLHVATGGLVYLLFRELHGSRARWGAAIAAALFLLHPAAEEVVPIIARRGYGLMTFFGAASAIAFVRACRRDRILSLPAAAAAIAFAASVLSTEVNFALVPMYPILAIHLIGGRDRSPIRPLAICALPLLTAVGVYGLRLAILGEHGGYHAEANWARGLAIAQESWRTLLFPASAAGERGFPPLAGLGWAIVIAYYGWRGAFQPLTRLRSREARLPLVLLIWTGGYFALSAVFGVWFDRQAYPALVPFSLLVAGVLQDTWRHRDPARPALGVLHGVPQALLLLYLVTPAPAFRGLDPTVEVARANRQARMQALNRDLERVREPAVIFLVLPRETPVRPNRLWSPNLAWQMSLTRYWMAALHADREIRFRSLALVESHPGDQPPVENVDRGGRQALIFSHSAAPQFPGGRNLLARQTDLDAGILWLDQLPVDDGVSGYVYSYEGTTGHLVPIRSGVGRSARSEVLEEGT